MHAPRFTRLINLSILFALILAPIWPTNPTQTSLAEAIEVMEVAPERLLARLQQIRRIERPVLLAVRNMLRHKGRLLQTLVVLVFCTALFVSVLSVRVSVDTLEKPMRPSPRVSSAATTRASSLTVISALTGPPLALRAQG